MALGLGKQNGGVENLFHTIAEGLGCVAQRNAAMLLPKDLQEALAAFMEKRAARFED